MTGGLGIYIKKLPSQEYLKCNDIKGSILMLYLDNNNDMMLPHPSNRCKLFEAIATDVWFDIQMHRLAGIDPDETGVTKRIIATIVTSNRSNPNNRCLVPT